MSIEVPGAYYTQANGNNTEGDVVGYYLDTSPLVSARPHGFLMRQGEFITIDDPEATSPYGTQAYGINPQDDIVGFFSFSGSRGNPRGFLLSNE